ncbi:MAG: radical SAM family heme chaperone HemW [Lachnospiraceae bacterium]|nr:radical SAM family heme chaperone HemW [Lachnospiraceae bacterium]
MNEISVYVHLPFCVKKCAYCDFLSGDYGDDVKRAYLDRILREIDHCSPVLSDRIIRSVYFGGGTPSLPDPSYISSIIRAVMDGHILKKDAEITIEMNPGTTDEKKVREYLKLGINRFSIGLQSMDENELKALGRIHDPDDFLYLYDLLRKNGASNINVDLMTGIPHQTPACAQRSLESVIALAPEHIAVYSLILEEGTPFYEKGAENLDLPDEDTEEEICEMTRLILAENGYGRYEISNYAKKGYECRHNLVYWDLLDYIGFGASAASRIGNRRYTNIRNVEAYTASEVPLFEEDLLLDESEWMSEFIIMGLRKTAGISLLDFSSRFGKELEEVYGDVIERYEGEGLLKKQEGRLFFTERGMDVSNIVLSGFV